MADQRKEKVDASAVASEQYIESLRRRLDVLEARLVGERSIREGQPPVRRTVASLENKLASLTRSRAGESVAEVWRKVDTLEKLMTSEYASYLKLTEDSKSELLFGYTAQLEPLAERLEEIQKLKDYVNTTEFQGLEGHEKRLAAVANTHTQQEMAVEVLSRQLTNLMEGYQRIMLQLSAQCVEWDEQVSRLESQS